VAVANCIRRSCIFHYNLPEYTTMIDSNALNDLAKRLTDAMPGDLRLLAGDMEKTFQGILQATFSRMNLVSREEFDVQRGVLERTRERLESLESRVAELEKQLPEA